ncbi:MAG: DUF3795 domain-containing protein [Desulfobacterales bacterium]|nr:DUF3795 domain-containing protein [Desulfobacterales bacterium]MCP4164248.1 DUF3795 domain-containing protein [Deltaproteobacteria bacterium]
MKGWTEDEIRNKDLRAPCGLHCGFCGVYISTRDKNEKFRDRLATLYGSKPEETNCMGCMQSDPAENLYGICQFCHIRNCVKEKDFYSCHQCDEWPCDHIENFGLATGKRVMMRTIPIWREKVAEFGDEKGGDEWVRSECERYHCSSCGNPLFRGAQKCRKCKKDVSNELDGTL